MKIKKVILTALLGAICQLAVAQGVRISGTLSDAEGPIMMGNVVEVDANNRIVSATQTDFNGNFSMQIKSTKNKLAAAVLKSDLGSMKKTLDVNEIGGTAMIGISKPVIKAHGSSDSSSIFAAIRQAIAFAGSGIIDDIKADIDIMKITANEEL